MLVGPTSLPHLAFILDCGVDYFCRYKPPTSTTTTTAAAAAAAEPRDLPLLKSRRRGRMAEIENGHVCLGGRTLSVSMEEIKDLEAGVAASASASGNGGIHRPAVVRAAKMWPAYGSLGWSFPSRSTGGAGRLFREDEGHHFLDACFLCKKPLGGHRDIFMYRGDTPFCSEECREEQIDIDEEKEKNWAANLPMKAATSRKEQNPNATDAIQVRAAGAIVAG